MTFETRGRAILLLILTACFVAPGALRASMPDRVSSDRGGSARSSGEARAGAETAAAPHKTAPACSLSPDQLAARREQLLPGFLDRAESVTEIRNGMRLRFTRHEGLVTELAQLIEQERDCCGFLSFRLIASGEAGPVILEVRGPRGTSELMRRLQRS